MDIHVESPIDLRGSLNPINGILILRCSHIQLTSPEAALSVVDPLLACLDKVLFPTVFRKHMYFYVEYQLSRVNTQAMIVGVVSAFHNTTQAWKADSAD